MEKMTPEARINYALGLVRADLRSLESDIAQMERELEGAKLVWWVVVVITSLALVLSVIMFQVHNYLDLAAVMLVLASFVVVRLISYRTMTRQLDLAKILYHSYEVLANDETLQFGFSLLKARADNDTDGTIKPTA